MIPIAFAPAGAKLCEAFFNRLNQPGRENVRAGFQRMVPLFVPVMPFVPVISVMPGVVVR